MDRLSRGQKGDRLQVQLSLAPLRNCLVNLPPSVCNALIDSNTSVQDVIVELSIRPGAAPQPQNGSKERSVFLGWTGMPSKSSNTENGLQGTSSNVHQGPPTVELDEQFARTLKLTARQKVYLTLHSNSRLAETIHIEPVTADDWEIIELHANFLELNLLSQIRAAPNPAAVSYPLTIHLSPTSIANILITSIEPLPPASVRYARLSEYAEVIVSPKVRQSIQKDNSISRPASANHTSRNTNGRAKDSAQVSSGSDRSLVARNFQCFRCIDRRLGGQWFEETDIDRGLCLWIDEEILQGPPLRGAAFATVSIIRPSSLEPITSAQAQQPQQTSAEGEKKSDQPARRIAVKLLPWRHAPDYHHVALSTALCQALDFAELVGGLVVVQPAPPQLSRDSVKALRIVPLSPLAQSLPGMKIGGDNKSHSKAASDQLRRLYWTGEGEGWTGPFTDGMIIPAQPKTEEWKGGILRFHPAISKHTEATHHFSWAASLHPKIEIILQSESLRHSPANVIGELVPNELSPLFGISNTIEEVSSHLLHRSSVFLTGAIGSGKSVVARLVSNQLQRDHLFAVRYFPCKQLTTQETSILVIEKTIKRLFAFADWGTKSGGRSLLILDDLDKLCPVETELQVGGDNSRSRQTSELVKSIIQRYAPITSRIVVIATSQSKDTLNSILVGGHIARETVHLKAPSKEQRRIILQSLTKTNSLNDTRGPSHSSGSSRSDGENNGWMDDAPPIAAAAPSGNGTGFAKSTSLNLLDLAGQIDGYMPADMELLVLRARSEALMREAKSRPADTENTTVELGQVDFEQALEGFTPVSLRKVTLQSSTVRFDSIGGLRQTRQILLETLQYPVKYAPIFAQCPLRLRSGLLLYGFPGCGKTMLASAVAGECGLNFISVKGPEILNKYIGASEKSIRDLFERAEAAKPCVLFFDEFDSIAPKRGHDSTGVTDRVVNQLLTQMDGAEGLSGVYVLAATSRPDLIDPALLRPGRLDKSLLCDMPSREDRLDILRAISTKVHLDEEVREKGLTEVAKRTEGYSGADLQALLYNAQLEAIQDRLRGEERSIQKQRNRSKRPGRNMPDDFFFFNYGEDVANSAKTNHATKHAISTQLQAIRAQKFAQKNKTVEAGGQDRHTTLSQPKDAEVQIEMEHLSAALSSTKSSLSTSERSRLATIYHDFIYGRDGKMATGDGSTEIGERSSLM